MKYLEHPFYLHNDRCPLTGIRCQVTRWIHPASSDFPIVPRSQDTQEIPLFWWTSFCYMVLERFVFGVRCNIAWVVCPQAFLGFSSTTPALTSKPLLSSDIIRAQVLTCTPMYTLGALEASCSTHFWPFQCHQCAKVPTLARSRASLTSTQHLLFVVAIPTQTSCFLSLFPSLFQMPVGFCWLVLQSLY